MDYNQLSARDQSARLYQLITPLLTKAGYERRKAKDTGGAQIMEIVRDGQALRAAYKTGRGRWFSMLPLGNEQWKTLDDADVLIFVTVSDPPKAFELYVSQLTKCESG